jgi:hypothetical protein
MRPYPVSAAVSSRCPEPKGRFPRVTHPCAAPPERGARLACVRRAASVRSEPGSNSQLHPGTNWHTKGQNQARPIQPQPARTGPRDPPERCRRRQQPTAACTSPHINPTMRRSIPTGRRAEPHAPRGLREPGPPRRRCHRQKRGGGGVLVPTPMPGKPFFHHRADIFRFTEFPTEPNAASGRGTWIRSRSPSSAPAPPGWPPRRCCARPARMRS